MNPVNTPMISRSEVRLTLSDSLIMNADTIIAPNAAAMLTDIPEDSSAVV